MSNSLIAWHMVLCRKGEHQVGDTNNNKNFDSNESNKKDCITQLPLYKNHCILQSNVKHTLLCP